MNKGFKTKKLLLFHFIHIFIFCWSPTSHVFLHFYQFLPTCTPSQNFKMSLGPVGVQASPIRERQTTEYRTFIHFSTRLTAVCLLISPMKWMSLDPLMCGLLSHTASLQCFGCTASGHCPGARMLLFRPFSSSFWQAIGFKDVKDNTSGSVTPLQTSSLRLGHEALSPVGLQPSKLSLLHSWQEAAVIQTQVAVQFIFQHYCAAFSYSATSTQTKKIWLRIHCYSGQLCSVSWLTRTQYTVDLEQCWNFFYFTPVDFTAIKSTKMYLNLNLYQDSCAHNCS